MLDKQPYGKGHEQKKNKKNTPARKHTCSAKTSVSKRILCSRSVSWTTLFTFGKEQRRTWSYLSGILKYDCVQGPAYFKSGEEKLLAFLRCWNNQFEQKVDDKDEKTFWRNV